MDRLGLTAGAEKLMEKVSEKDFEIFELKRETKDNELVTMASMLL